MKIKVTYMSGAGNLFSVIDNRKYDFSIKQGEILAKILCSKNDLNDFQTEGLMFLEKHNENLDFECKFFNPDGSTGMMCGNGGRAITRFAELSGMLYNKSSIKFLMSGSIYHSEILGSEIKLFMPPPSILPYRQEITINNQIITGYFSNTGTFHFVLNTEENYIDFNNFNINEIGSKIRLHNSFEPNGTNVNFTKLEGNSIHLRTFEKGVEAETGACGTGAVATALTYNMFYNIEFPISIIPTSKENLTIDIVKENDGIKNIILQGPAKVLYEIELNLTDKILLV